MSRYTFEIADPSNPLDDAGLRKRMREDHMKGSLSVSFRREPDFFAALSVMGDRAQVIKCQDRSTGEILGMGSRALLDATVFGERTQLGYLSDLRAAPKARGTSLLGRGYRFLRTLHDSEEQKVPFYFSLIFDGNRAALDALTKQRKISYFPSYVSLGKFFTPAVFLHKKRNFKPLKTLSYSRASESEMAEVFQFIQSQSKKRSIAPWVESHQLGSSRLSGLQASDFFIARQAGKIVVAIAAWDQSGLRQTHIEAYSRALRWSRPLINGVGRALYPARPELLPQVGSALQYFYLAFCYSLNDDVGNFRSLLEFLYQTKRQEKHAYFVPGFHERNPLRAALVGFEKIASNNDLFVIKYGDTDADGLVQKLVKTGIPQLEIATL